MTDVDLKTFPSNRYEALSFLYLENQNLSGLSPEEIAQLYLKSNKEIQLAFRKKGSRDEEGFPQITL